MRVLTCHLGGSGGMPPPPEKFWISDLGLRSFLVQSGSNRAITIPSGSISMRTAETAEP